MKKLTMTLILTAALPLSSCATMSAGVEKGDERNFTRSLNDDSSARTIKARMRRAQDFDFKGVDVEVAEGTVLLSGNVPSSHARIEAERIAWSAPKVFKVGNELFVKGNQGATEKRKDRFISSKLKRKFIADKTVKARNYNIEVHDRIVYLLGVARTRQELERAAYVASITKDVAEVISYVRLAEDARTNYQEPPTIDTTKQASSEISTTEDEESSQYYQDPETGEYYRILSSGVSSDATRHSGTGFPTDQDLGAYRTGSANETVSVIESEPFYLDPDTGEKIPVSAVLGTR